jgi:hypothetical protein
MGKRSTGTAKTIATSVREASMRGAPFFNLLSILPPVAIALSAGFTIA